VIAGSPRKPGCVNTLFDSGGREQPLTGGAGPRQGGKFERRRRARRRRPHRSRVAETLSVAVGVEETQIELRSCIEGHFRGDLVRGGHAAPDRLFNLKHIHYVTHIPDRWLGARTRRDASPRDLAPGP
jgi:hypothetical protein